LISPEDRKSGSPKDSKKYAAFNFRTFRPPNFPT
jgi:hypothetical protein